MKYTDIIPIIFVDRNFEVIQSLVSSFSSINGPKFIHTDIFSQGFGTLISPANSIGNMDGGIDLEYREKFSGIEDRIQSFIKETHSGKLQIGSAQMVPTYDSQFPYIIFSPTIETPCDPTSEENIYRASKAVFQTALEYNRKGTIPEDEKISRLLIPGFGTGYAQFDPQLSARQVAKAYRDVSKKYNLEL
ncbi:MAG: macro domain-containing protein [Candidatus Woesearchaeota archaeon]